MLAHDLEELVQECLDLSNLLERGWKSVLDCLFNGHIDNMDAAGITMQIVFHRTLGVFHKLQNLIAYAGSKDCAVDGFRELHEATKRIAQLKTEAEKHWPSVDRCMIEESIAAFQAGEYQSTEDMLHDLESSGARANQ